MTVYGSCPTVGCPTTGGGAYMRKHVAKQHFACSCGWAGPYHGMHVGQVTRRVKDGYRDPGEGMHEMILMEFDDGLDRWVRVSTPGGVKE